MPELDGAVGRVHAEDPAALPAAADHAGEVGGALGAERLGDQVAGSSGVDPAGHHLVGADGGDVGAVPGVVGERRGAGRGHGAWAAVREPGDTTTNPSMNA